MAEPGDRERRERDEQQLSGLAEAYRKAGPIMAASTSLVVAVGVFTWLGHVADEKLGNRTPWLTLLGVAVGMTGGFISFFKAVLGKQKRS
jgi:F0F1-type ATP synthase assembly protein I